MRVIVVKGKLGMRVDEGMKRNWDNSGIGANVIFGSG